MCERTKGGHRTELGHQLRHMPDRRLTGRQQMERSGTPRPRFLP